MKNVASPLPEEFVLTKKKMRMIKALMLQFKISKEYELYLSNDEYVPKLDEYGMFLKDRLAFLKNIRFGIAIEMRNHTWTGLHFSYNEKSIEIYFKQPF